MNYVERVRRTIETTISDWADHWTSKGPAKIHEMLDGAAEQIVCGVLGFTNRFGRWEIDRSHNGKDSDSYIGRYIKGHAEKEIHKWLEENLPKILAKPFPPETLRAARAEYLRVFSYKLEQKVRDFVDKDVDRVARELADECEGLLNVNPEGLLVLESRERLGDKKASGG